jgi:TPP-dependent pyruvate/acetoin dehydrogenase alpha subunit
MAKTKTSKAAKRSHTTKTIKLKKEASAGPAASAIIVAGELCAPGSRLPESEPGSSRVEIREAKDELRHMLKQMMQIRAFEEKVFELLARDVLKGASHVYAGQEAVAVGACAVVGPEDFITSTHRGHGHCLSRGGVLKYMLAELCGKATGYCRGRGGSMHIADVKAGNLGATGIVGGNVPVGTGAGLACKLNAKGQVTLCFFGDGASNNGVFHESLNLAGRWKLPTVYVCENNLYGMSVPFCKACAVENVADRACAYDMPGEVVDGMRVLEVKRAVERAVARARKGGGPTLIEAKTYRYRGHSRSDPRKYRTKEEEQYYHDRDPITQFRTLLESEDVMTVDEMDAVGAEVDAEMAEAERFALEESPYPDPSELTEDVYAGWREGPLGLEPVKG